jgi:hypothetical protein
VNDVLYVFYTSTNTYNGYRNDTIYYRTVTVDYGATGTGWNLVFSELKSFTAEVSPVKIQTAQLMNDTIYVIYSAGDSWYSKSSSDGLNFGSKTTLFSAPNIKGGGAAVFQIPDATQGSVDKMMIAYVNGSALNYYFFDGNVIYGPYNLSTSGLYPYSVRLIAGSAEGYSNTKYSIQVFITHNQDQTWHAIYHREYIPAGINGSEGSWSSAWNKLASSADDAVHTDPTFTSSDPTFAVIPLFLSSSTDPNSNIQMYLRLWYYRGVTKTSGNDVVNFRCSSYVSDVLVHQTQGNAGPEKQDMTTQTVIGVIEGTPPWPANGGGGHNDTSNTSWVEFGQSETVTIDTSWTVGGSVMVYFGMSWEKKGGWKTKLTGGVKYTKTTQTSNTYSVGQVLKTYNDTVPGQLGWVVLIIPDINNDSYVLKAYDGHALAYGGDTSGDEVTAYLITYGPRTTVNLEFLEAVTLDRRG